MIWKYKLQHSGEKGGKCLQLLTQSPLNLSTNFNESVAECPEGIGKQFTELSQT